MESIQSIKLGDTVLFGTHSKTGNPEEWVVLMKNNKDKTALIASTESVARIPYFNPHVDDANKPVSWKNCFIRKWLNRHYCDHFSWQEEEAIHYVTMPEYENDEDSVLDRVFILNEGEASLFFKNDENRVLLCNHEYNWFPEDGWRNSCSWWLRDPVVSDPETNGIKAPVCSETGALGESLDVESSLGVRACMWVDICALTKVLNPDLEDLNVRLIDKTCDTLTIFRDGQEQEMDVLAEFVDYDIKQSFAILQDKSVDRPIIARTNVDFFIKSQLEDKYAPLINTLKYKPYCNVSDMFQHKHDELSISELMNQEAWSPTPGCWQPEITDDGYCFIQIGRDCWNQNRDDERLYWKVIKRQSNKVLCVCEDGIVLDGFMKDNYEEGFEEDVCWEFSAIRRQLNEDFLNQYISEEEEKRLLYYQTVKETDLTPALYDKVFLLSDAEVSIFMPTAQDRIIRGTPSHETIGCGYPLSIDEDSENWWWLRTSGRKAECICCVSPSGLIDRGGKWGREGQYAVRPAILVELTDDEIPYIRK